MSQACRFEFENDRGQKLQGVEYIPSSKQWATLVWNHGVCEHKERYVPGKGCRGLLLAVLQHFEHLCSIHQAADWVLSCADLEQLSLLLCRAVAVFEQLANAGVAVYCFDVHGHGTSEPKEPSERGLIRKYKHLVSNCYCAGTSQPMAAHSSGPYCVSRTHAMFAAHYTVHSMQHEMFCSAWPLSSIG